jgi:NAD(P)-dependent dehydrogenase (short-subunit alcohol dehydrogenase family)
VILVTGATGNAGGAVVRALVSAGEDVRALIRPGGDQSALPAGAEGVAGDLNRPETLSAALAGVVGDLDRLSLRVLLGNSKRVFWEVWSGGIPTTASVMVGCGLRGSPPGPQIHLLVDAFPPGPQYHPRQSYMKEDDENA